MKHFDFSGRFSLPHACIRGVDVNAINLEGNAQAKILTAEHAEIAKKNKWPRINTDILGSFVLL